jgi:hypothetical protein
MSRCHELCGSLPSALHCALEALRIRQAALPPAHKDVSDAVSRVRELEQLMREARASSRTEAAAAHKLRRLK